jgi:ribosomal-protein-alanine N-acetyltransferase
MTMEDVPQVAQIEKESFSMPWSEKSFTDALTDKNNIYVVALIEDNIVGYCGMWGCAGEGQIYNVCVRKAMRGKGVGSILFKGFLDEGIKAGLKAFTLEVRVSNQNAISMYEKYGFENAGIRKNFYENPKEDAMIMWLYV